MGERGLDNVKTVGGAAETKDHPRAQCTLRLHPDRLHLDWTASGLDIPWADIEHADVSKIQPQQPTKMVLAAKIRGDPWLINIWLHTLTELDTVLNCLEPHCRAEADCIPPVLHTPALLKYYRPWLRLVIVVLATLYKALLAMAMLFYVTKVLALIPDLSSSLAGPLHTGQAVATRLASEGYLWCTAGWLQIVACGTVSAFVGPVLLTTLLPAAAMFGAFMLAQHYVSLLLSLTLLGDVERVVKSIRGVLKMVMKVGGVVFKLVRSKPPTLIKAEKED